MYWFKRLLLILALALLNPDHSFALTPIKKDALMVSFGTPESSRGLKGREKIIQFLQDQKFNLTLVTDRFKDQFKEVTDRIDPTPQNFLSTFEKMANDPTVMNLLILTDLHGMPRAPGEKTHSVLFGDDHISLDLLIPGLEEIHRRGGTVAWMDFSCYSGSSMPLGKTGACVASNGDPASPTLPNFIDHFADSIEANHSFEDAFLKSRIQHKASLLPMISSSIGRRLSRTEEPVEELIHSKGVSSELKESVLGLPWKIEESDLNESSKDSFANQSRKLSLIMSVMAPLIRYHEVILSEREWFDRSYRAAKPKKHSDCSNFIF